MNPDEDRGIFSAVRHPDIEAQTVLVHRGQFPVVDAARPRGRLRTGRTKGRGLPHTVPVGNWLRWSPTSLADRGKRERDAPVNRDALFHLALHRPDGCIRHRHELCVCIRRLRRIVCRAPGLPEQDGCKQRSGKRAAEAGGHSASHRPSAKVNHVPAPDQYSRPSRTPTVSGRWRA